jgi:hypothetical protein
MIGWSAGFCFLYVGLDRSADGRSTRAALIAAWTSRAAPSMSRLRPNWRVMFVLPTALVDVISVTSAIVPRWRSSGVATLVDMVSGLAPAIDAETLIVAESTCGNGETASLK